MDKALRPYVKIGDIASCWVRKKGVMWLDKGRIKDVTNAGIVISLYPSNNRNKKPEMYKGDFIVKWNFVNNVYRIIDIENKIISELKKLF